MELVGPLSNQPLQERLQQLANKLDQLAASNAPPRPSARADQRIRSGVVLQAVTRVLEVAQQPLRTYEVHQAVSTLLKQPVLYGTVKGCLASRSHGDKAPFERVARGYYRLKPQT
jgi:hypothetical protein